MQHKFNLIDNAKESLSHAVRHLTDVDHPTGSDLKRAILDVAHVVELLLKERVRKVHPSLLWKDVDKYPSDKAFKVDTQTAIHRLVKIAGIKLEDSYIKTIIDCRNIRNDIEHYEFEIESKEARIIIGKMLAFIFHFAKVHLDMDWVVEFKKEERWKTLVDMYEFWEHYSATVEKQLVDDGKDVCECRRCDMLTFDLAVMQCALCGHHEEQIECESCGELCWESEIDFIETAEGLEHAICNNCLRADMYEE